MAARSDPVWFASSSARYALLDEIAKGGMASVHVARQSGPAGFGRLVAIKLPHPHLVKDEAFVAMFLDEARLAAHVRHPNVVATLDVLAGREGMALVMEYVAGVSLARLMVLEQPTPEIAVAIGVSILRGLHAAHQASDDRGRPLGLIHRDVSPQNVLVDADGVVRVADFGIAKAALNGSDTHPDMLKGKLAYMAPEQLRRERVDRRTDIYAASVVIWELLTGERMFAGGERAEVELGGLRGRVPALSPALEEVVMRGLESDRERRFESAQTMALALERALTPAPPDAVAAWVQRVAGGLLLERERRMASREPGEAVPASEAPTIEPPTIEPPTIEPAERPAVAPHRGSFLTTASWFTALMLAAFIVVAVLRAREPQFRDALSSGLAPSITIVAPVPSPPRAEPPPSAPPSVAMPTHSKARCSPPWVIDPKTGVKRYKRECL